jgi:predicted site-specific integrase-resolvase
MCAGGPDAGAVSVVEPSGTILVDVAAPTGVVLSARVSRHDERSDFGSPGGPVDRDGPHSMGGPVGSGVNRKRPKRARVLSDPSAMVSVVVRRVRLARFGVAHLHTVLAAQCHPESAAAAAG